MTARREVALLGVACGLLYFTGLGQIPFYTRGEPREGLVVREMLQRRAWLVPARPEGEPARKPPLYYWLAASALSALPHAPELALRLPSAVLATAAALVTWASARAVAGAAAGLPAALVLATAFEWVRAATSARVDMTFAAALTLALAGWMRVLSGGGAPWLVLAGAGIGLGALAKGPAALALPALAAGTAALAGGGSSLLRRLRPVRVLGGAAVLAGLWYGLAYLRSGEAFLDVVVRENWLRIVDPEGGATGHAHAAWYLLPLGLVGLLPWTPLLALALAPLRARPRSPALVLAAAWVVVGFLVFSLAAAKRSVYLLPLYPALALLIGAGVAAPAVDGWPARTTTFLARLYAPVLGLLAALAGAYALGLDPGARVRPWLRAADAAGAATLAEAARAVALPLGMLALATLALVPRVLHAARAGAWRALVPLVAAAAVGWSATFQATLHPPIAQARTLRPFLARVGHLVPREAPLYALYSADFPPDPGLRFYAPRPLRAWPGRGIEGSGHLLLWEDEWRRLRSERGQPLDVLAVSEARRSRRGHLALVRAPRGRLVAQPTVALPSQRPPPPGLRATPPARAR